jgi:D-sedoheptulose 7-phosphate isomerase
MTAPELYGQEHARRLAVALADFEPGLREAYSWGERLAGVLPPGGRLLCAGNGGSAAQAQHLTGELVGRYRTERPPYSALCLSAETSSLTAIGNDYPAEELFARQVEAHGRPGDVFLAFSTSGHSGNVVAAAERARSLGLQVWSLTGRAPNPLAACAHSWIAVDAADTATVQELHLVALHVICEGFDDVVCDSEAAGARRFATA